MSKFEVVTEAPSGSAEWLEARKSGIGASDIAAVLGISPFKSALELYAEKIGEEHIEEPQGENMTWGLLLEPVIVAEFGRRTGRVVEPAGKLLRSTEEPWALATPDAWCVNGTRWPLQIKTTGGHRAADWENGTPEHIVAQVQHEMIVTGADKATVACLIGGNRMVWEDVPADPTWRNRILRAGAEFWDRVQSRTPPPVDGSDATKRRLAALFPADTGDVVTLGTEFADLDAELAGFKATRDECDRRIREIENMLRAAIGTASFGSLPDGTMWRWRVEPRDGYTVAPCSPRVLRRIKAKGAK